MSSHLIREYIRALVSEVDVLSPDKDPRMGGTSHDSFDAQKNSLDPNKKKIGHSKEYGNKEATRDKVQKVIAKKVKGGGIQVTMTSRVTSQIRSEFARTANLRTMKTLTLRSQLSRWCPCPFGDRCSDKKLNKFTTRCIILAAQQFVAGER